MYSIKMSKKKKEKEKRNGQIKLNMLKWAKLFIKSFSFLFAWVFLFSCFVLFYIYIYIYSSNIWRYITLKFDNVEVNKNEFPVSKQLVALDLDK